MPPAHNRKELNQMNHRRHIPTHPGAMTPAQLIRRTLARAAAAIITAATVAALTALFIIFN